MVATMSNLPGEVEPQRKDPAGHPEDLWSLLEHLPGAAYRCLLDPERAMTFISEGCRELTGYCPADLLRDGPVPLDSLVVDEDRAQLETRLWAELRRQRTYALEYRLRDRNGRVKTVWDKGRVLLSKDGGGQTLEGFIWDVTDRKRVEKLQAIAHRIAYSANRGLSLEALFKYIHSELAAILEIKNIYIALYDRGRQTILFPYYLDENFQHGPRVRSRKQARGLTEYVLRTGKALIADAGQVQKLAEAGEIEILGPLPQMWLGAPLQTEKTAVGVIAIQSYSKTTVYNRSDLELLEFVSSQIAAVIERKHAEEALAARERQSAALAGLGQRALAGATVDELFGAAVTVVSQALDVELAKVLELDPESDSMLLRAGVGWKDGYVGRTHVGIGPESQAGYTLLNREPVVVEDLATETRFQGPDLLVEHGIVSGVSVAILGPKRPYGVLSVHTRLKRAFGTDDIHFLQGIAGLLAEAIIRQETETALRVSEERLRESEERFRKAFEYASTGKALVGLDGRMLRVNRAFCEMLGYSEDELLNASYRVITHPDDLPAQERLTTQLVEGAVASFRMEKRYQRRDGRTVWAELSVAAVRDQAGEPLHLVTEVKDISEWKRFEAQLVHLANHDPLTNLYNRRRFQDELERLLAQVRRYEMRGAVLFLDLDQFKDVNDHLGHQAGDELLIGIARLLRARLRQTDTLARLGGDEFAVILPHANADQAKVAAEHFLETIRGHALALAGHQVNVTSSLGIVLFPDHGTTADELLARADIAMYKAKHSGGDRIALYQPDEEADRHPLQGQDGRDDLVRQGLEKKLFVLYCQPILELGTDEVTCYELLLRMRGEDGELVYPSAFLDAAERSGMIRDIDRWVVCEAIRLLAAPGAIRRKLRFEVNVSGKTFSDRHFLQIVRRDLAAAKVDPSRLVLSASEHAVAVNPIRALEFLGALKEIGCGFALDNFGAGFSSLMQMKHFPLDYVKIDGSFIENLPSDPVDLHMVTALAGMAHGLGKQTVAGFVGDDRTVDLLRQCGVDFAQGFHLGRPVPVGDVITVDRDREEAVS